MKATPRLFARLVAVLSAALVLGACTSLPGDERAPTIAPTAVLLQTAPPPATAIPTSRPPHTTVSPTAAPLPSPTPCRHATLPALADAWNAEELGCPITPGGTAINTAYAPFEGGQMLWREDTDAIYVLYHDGHWESYPNEWRAGDAEFSCGDPDPQTTPVRGFGRVWCDHPAVRRTLGAVTAAEIGDSASTVQDFVNGSILVAPFGGVFVLEGEIATWRLHDPGEP